MRGTSFLCQINKPASPLIWSTYPILYLSGGRAINHTYISWSCGQWFEPPLGWLVGPLVLKITTHFWWPVESRVSPHFCWHLLPVRAWVWRDIRCGGSTAMFVTKAIVAWLLLKWVTTYKSRAYSWSKIRAVNNPGFCHRWWWPQRIEIAVIKIKTLRIHQIFDER